MKVRDYERATLGDGRLVVPEHKPNGVPVLSRWDGAVMIKRKEI